MALSHWFYEPNLERFRLGHQNIESSNVIEVTVYDPGNKKADLVNIKKKSSQWDPCYIAPNIKT